MKFLKKEINPAYSCDYNRVSIPGDKCILITNLPPSYEYDLIQLLDALSYPYMKCARTICQVTSLSAQTINMLEDSKRNAG